MTTRRGVWTVVNGTLAIAILFGGWWVLTHRQDIIDWWHLRSYTPPTAIVQLADADTMVGRGRDMFYASDPRVESRDSFNMDCQNTGSAGEQGAVLGCYVHQNIYIYDVNDPRLPGVKEVTAAHEMLHAAYERLDAATKTHINGLLQTEIDRRSSDTDLQEVIALYNKTEPGELMNEMHSILGTEYGDLSPDLETYYKQYFTDRSQVVADAAKYKGVFAESKARIAAYQQQLESLKKQIDTNTSQLEQLNNELTTESAQLDALRRSDPANYNQQVPAYNTKVNQYNTLARATQGLVTQYNEIVVKVNGEAALQTDLAHSLDSRYQPVTSN